MVEDVKKMLLGQYEAALSMLTDCVRTCPPEHWEGRIANDTFRQIAYHTLFFTDYYLSAGEAAFELRELHERGGDERQPMPSPGVSQDETLSYAATCRQKAIDVLSGESADSLQGPSGFPRRDITRGELHIYNIRHIQHHGGAMSAYLRRIVPSFKDSKVLRWVGTGWQS